MFPSFPSFCDLKETGEKPENQSHAVLPSKDCDGAGVWEPMLLHLSQQLSQLSWIVHARVAPCALTSAAPSLYRSSAVSLPLKAHTVQIIKHLWGILHFHESINSELFLNMLRPYTPRFLSIICRWAWVASSCVQKVRLELASYLQACFSRPWA